MKKPEFIREIEPKIHPCGSKSRRAIYKCGCGKEFISYPYRIANGSSKSCGCLKTAIVVQKCTTHGLTHHPLFRTYYNMIYRCYLPSHVSYKNYGAKGIGVCKRWRTSFMNFFNDMVSTHKDGLTLERNKNSMGYSKNNCRWATWSEQAKNRSKRISKNNSSTLK